jgi:hypothetical protein
MKVEFKGKSYRSYRVLLPSPGIYEIPDDIARRIIRRHPDMFARVEEKKTGEGEKEENNATGTPEVPRRRKRGRPSTQELLAKFKKID